MSAAKFATLSTTKLMRLAIDATDGDVSQALALLDRWSYDCSNSKSAMYWIRERAKGAARVEMGKSGFIAPVASSTPHLCPLCGSADLQKADDIMAALPAVSRRRMTYAQQEARIVKARVASSLRAPHMNGECASMEVAS